MQVLGGRYRLGQQGRVLAPHERRGHADPKLAVPARNVVNQVGESLGHWRFGVAGKKCLHPIAGLSDVERVPDRLFADPVHHGRAGRFDGGDRGQLLGKVAFQRSGHHYCQVGLHQEVVDRFGQRPGHGIDRGGRIVGFVQQHAAGPTDRPATHQSHCVTFGQQIGEGLGLQAPSPARAPPDQCRRGRGGIDTGAGG